MSIEHWMHRMHFMCKIFSIQSQWLLRIESWELERQQMNSPNAKTNVANSQFVIFANVPTRNSLNNHVPKTKIYIFIYYMNQRIVDMAMCLWIVFISRLKCWCGLYMCRISQWHTIHFENIPIASIPTGISFQYRFTALSYPFALFVSLSLSITHTLFLYFFPLGEKTKIVRIGHRHRVRTVFEVFPWTIFPLPRNKTIN